MPLILEFTNSVIGQLTPRSSEGLSWLLRLWILTVGGCIGSFLNVVVYRLPAGLSLSHPGSHCPKCGHAIRARDNVPVLGWLGLKGRCRDCHAAISIRYPLVEALIACVFLGLWVVHAESPLLAAWESGSTWPIAPLARFVQWSVWLCTLVSASLILWDGQLVPLRLWWPSLLTIAFAELLRQGMTLNDTAGSASLAWAQAIGLGMCVGWVLGLIVGPVVARKSSAKDIAISEHRSSRISTLITGGMLGWWPVTVGVVLASTIWLAARIGIGRSKSLPWTAAFSVSSFCLAVLPVDAAVAHIAQRGPALQAMVIVVTVVVLGLTGGLIRRSTSAIRPDRGKRR